MGDVPESKYDCKDWHGEKNGGTLAEICTGPELTSAPSSVDPEGETAESTDDGLSPSQVALGCLEGSHSMSTRRTFFPDGSVQNADSAKTGCSVRDQTVDPDASTVDEEGQMLDSTEIDHNNLWVSDIMNEYVFWHKHRLFASDRLQEQLADGKLA